ncbi:hypothetical protein BDW62DRAFT_175043 [Aspergillus aurantiobrunneus]
MFPYRAVYIYIDICDHRQVKESLTSCPISQLAPFARELRNCVISRGMRWWKSSTRVWTERKDLWTQYSLSRTRNRHNDLKFSSGDELQDDLSNRGHSNPGACLDASRPKLDVISPEAFRGRTGGTNCAISSIWSDYGLQVNIAFQSNQIRCQHRISFVLWQEDNELPYSSFWHNRQP